MKNFLQHLVPKKTADIPLATSLEDPESKLDYKSLDRQGTAFAALLKDAGCIEGERLCCMTRKTVSAFVAMLGIMKAGCVCIPVNPDASDEDIQSIMVESDSRWLLTDESATAYPDSLLIDTGEISVGWLGDVNNIPENISPEFALTNMAQYAPESADAERATAKPVFRFIMSGNKGYMEELCISPAGIKILVSQFGAVLNNQESVPTAGIFPDSLCRFFLELLGPAKRGARYQLVSSSILRQPQQLIPLLNRYKVKRIFIQKNEVNMLAEDLKELSVSLKSVKEVVIWGKLPSREKVGDLKTLFPHSKIKNRISGSGYSSSYEELVDGKATGPAPFTQIKHRSLEHWEKIFFGLVQESALSRMRHVDYIQDMKTAYLNYWRKVEEKNLLMAQQPMKIGLPNDT